MAEAVNEMALPVSTLSILIASSLSVSLILPLLGRRACSAAAAVFC